MNTVCLTGYLKSEAWDTTNRLGERFVMFDLFVPALPGEKTPDGKKAEDIPWRCEMPFFDGQQRLAKLQPGAQLIVEARLAGRPFEKHGVREGYTRFLEVRRVEFSHVPKSEAAPEPAAATVSSP